MTDDEHAELRAEIMTLQRRVAALEISAAEDGSVFSALMEAKPLDSRNLMLRRVRRMAINRAKGDS